MADGDGLSPDRRKKGNSANSNKEDNSEIRGQFVELDLGDDNLRKSEIHRLGNQNIGAGTSSADGSRREDNPFSFKHFLRCDSSYQNKGARPKVYCDGRPVSTVREAQGQAISENPSALPDFVQDHLVIEQSFLSNEPTCNYNIGAQLPDFTQNNHNTRQNVEVNTVPNNLTNGADPSLARPQVNFPLDLPSILNNGRPGTSIEVAVSKSLPDFLNDGAVRSQTNENLSADQSPERDPERLQRELKMVKRQLVKQTMRADLLKRELEGVRSQEHEYTQNLIKALEQVEDNLEHSNRRAVAAEATVLKLRHEISMIKKENSALKAESTGWGGTEGAAGGPRQYTPPNNSQRLAQELRSAASTAEVSLRQLLSGVDNLRLLASTLENMHRIGERNEPFLNTDENSGPAL